MNDTAELVAVGLSTEAMELQVDPFPDGVEFIIDNQAVCFACQTLVSGEKLRTSTAHYPTYRRLERVITNFGRPGFLSCRWVPSRTKESDGHDEEMVSADDRHLNAGADDLATRGRVLKLPTGRCASSGSTY